VSDQRLVVTQDIPYNNGTVYAYRRGERVEPDAVKENGWEDYVASPATKAAREALGLSDDEQPKSAVASTKAAAGGEDK